MHVAFIPLENRKNLALTLIIFFLKITVFEIVEEGGITWERERERESAHSTPGSKATLLMKSCSETQAIKCIFSFYLKLYVEEQRSYCRCHLFWLWEPLDSVATRHAEFNIISKVLLFLPESTCFAETKIFKEPTFICGFY